MYSTFHEMLAERAAARGFEGAEGKERFRLLLIRKGVDPSLTIGAVNHWWNGHRVPSLPTLLAIFDALDVYGEDRDRMLRLAAKLPPEKEATPGDEAAA